MDIQIVPVRVPSPQGIRTMYDLELDGRPIKGARSFTKAEAKQQRDAMMRSKVWKTAQSL